MRKKKHFPEIDYLKALAALQVVLIHVLARYKGTSDLMFMFWDLIHFSVGLFVLASGFLFENSSFDIKDRADVWKYLVKKFKRIVLPYYFFVVLFLITQVIAGGYNWEKVFTLSFISQTVFLVGGVGGNWIPRLFMSISVVMLLEKILSKAVRWIKPLFFAICFSATLYSLTRSLDFMGSFNNIFGWLTIFYVGRYLYTKKDNSTALTISLGAFVVTILLYFVMEMMGLKLGIFANKYPPNIYFVAFNVFASVGTLLIMRLFSERFKNVTWLNRVVSFFSRYSYEMFFFHLLVMELYTFKFHWFVDWVIVLFFTCLLIIVLRKDLKIKERFSKLMKK